MKKIYCVLLVLCCMLQVGAQNVNLNEAAAAASAFLRANGRSSSHCVKVVKNTDADTLLYIFNAENCFVVVGADKRVPPILAFTDHQLYSDADVIPPVQMWLDNYAAQISDLKQSSAAVQTLHPDWTKLAARETAFRDVASVAPLMKSHWGQGEYYNYYCPRDFSGENSRVVTGCVATAMSQLIYYYRFPQTGVGSYSYLDSTYGVQSTDYGASTYDYAAMCDEPTSINPAISKLIRDFGVGVDMVYGPDGSGMYNHSAAYVLRTYFKYAPETEYLFRDSTNLDWDSVLVSHLNRQMPLYYAGWSTPNINGHGFICDGYRLVDSNYYYHFNFGWDGSSDGYFYTNALNLAGTHFNLSQEVIVNAYPDTLNYTYPAVQPLTGVTTLTSAQGSFTDGSLDYAPYANNMDYTWKICPQVVKLTGIDLDVDYDLAAGDTLYILPLNSTAYEGTAITGDSGTLHLSWALDSVMVRFVTDNTDSRLGFRFNYTTTKTVYCQDSQSYTSQTGTLTDGSEDEMYNDLTNCKFRIILNGVTGISLHFREFDLEEGHDFLYVFDNTATNAHLLDTYTGTMTDTVIIYDKKRLAFVFESDEQNNAPGFVIDYAGGQVGVDDFEAASLCVYPNPATHVLNVKDENNMDKIMVRDLLGRVVKCEFPKDVQTQLSVEDLSKGVYLLQIFTGNEMKTVKFVKQ
ncbi:MAG: C10 family peptidase [Bacteroidales bacterium]|nr:C10 family peptidase [Bacteroidales bacterium]